MSVSDVVSPASSATVSPPSPSPPDRKGSPELSLPPVEGEPLIGPMLPPKVSRASSDPDVGPESARKAPVLLARVVVPWDVVDMAPTASDTTAAEIMTKSTVVAPLSQAVNRVSQLQLSLSFCVRRKITVLKSESKSVCTMNSCEKWPQNGIIWKSSNQKYGRRRYQEKIPRYRRNCFRPAWS